MSGGRKSQARLFCGAAAVALAMASAPAAALARENVKFDIPPQSLTSALNEFGVQSQRAVLFTTDLTGAKTSGGVSSEVAPEDALAQMLAGTGLSYRKNGDTFLIVQGGSGDPQSASAGGDVDALIVTAQKREEDIQDVPIAISAFSQEDLTRSQIAGGPDLITQVPNMTFTKTNFSSYSVQLRGIGTQAISATTDPAVAVAFNNTPFIRNRFFEQEFYDLQRVEVLRGPQGTLYGRNATAGVVNIISAKPRFVAESKLSVDVANFNSSRLEGMVNIPVVEDKVALRLAGAWTKRDGYATNELTGNPIDGRDLWSTRASLRVSPNDAIDINLIWEHFQEDDDRLRSGKQLCKKDVVTEVVGASPSPPGVDVTNIPFFTDLPNVGQRAVWATVQAQLSQGCARESLYSSDSFQTPNGASVPYYVPLGGIGLPTTLYDPYVRLFQSQDLRMIESTVDPHYRAEADLGELQVSWDIADGLTLSSETAYSRDFVWSTQDFNRFNTAPGAWSTTNGGAPQLVTRGILDENGVFCDPQVGCSDRLVAVDLSTAKSSQFSQEFRLGSDFDGPFNFSLGANFLRADSEDKYYVFINSLTLIAAASGSNAGDLLPYEVGVSDNSQCLDDGFRTSDPNSSYGYTCVYIDPNPIESLNDQGHNYFLSKNPYKLISYAVFGEAYYNVTDSLKLTGGLRWTVDKKEAPRVPSWTLAGESFGYPVKEVIRLEWREPTGRLTIDWKPDLPFTDETLLYASYAHGYKAGGSNPPPFTFIGPPPESFGGQAPSQTRPTTFDAEFVDAYELGAKNIFLDGRVTANLAAFYYDYKGYQVSEIVDRSAFNRNFDATVWGVELEADWRVLENLRLGFKGGYEKTRIADGEKAIDLMDRTAGHEDWLVLRPFPTFASNCILPKFLFAHEGPTTAGQGVPNLYGLGAVGGASIGGCEIAYFGNKDPVTNLPYVPNPTVAGDTSTLGFWFPGTYPGWDPTDESQGHNHGEGFLKELGGNELPNAPQWTATITADYTVPLPNEWLATLHTDLHWQDESWWRVFNDHEFGRLDEYFTMNLAAIFTNEDAGWNIMAYIKNVTDETAITGAFLNSDDTGLTTNVFLTEPRLYGLRVTKNWTGGPLWGSFGARREGPYPFTIEVGGQVQRQDALTEAVRPGFASIYPDALDNFDEAQNGDLDWGDGGDVKLTWRPNGSPWTLAAGVRFGKANGGEQRDHAQADIEPVCGFGGAYTAYCEPKYPSFHIFKTDWSDVVAKQREEHQVIDFSVGRDIGIGELSRSSITGGLRYAQFKSRTHLQADAIPNWYVPEEWLKYSGLTTYTRLEGVLEVEREFTGTGPTISWDAAARLFGDNDAGHVDLDWSVGGGVLFGKQKVSRTGTETATYYGSYGYHEVWYEPISGPVVTSVNDGRSQSATVSTFAASLGLSYQVDRFQMGAGYRWERYFDVLDAGDAEDRSFDRTIDGPYFKVSVGFGG